MAAPLRSANPGQQNSVQFAHFGVLDAGHQSKASTMTSLVINLAIGFVVVVISLAHKQIVENTKLLTNLVVPVVQKQPEPPKPKITPPKPKPLPELAKIEQPKIIVPVKQPDLPKQPIVKMDQPKPILMPVAPKRVIAMAAPVAAGETIPQIREMETIPLVPQTDAGTPEVEESGADHVRATDGHAFP